MKIMKPTRETFKLRANYSDLFDRLLDLKSGERLPIKFGDNDKPHNVLAPLYSRAKRRNLKLEARKKGQIYYLRLVTRKEIDS